MKEVRVGIELREVFTRSAGFYRRWHGMPVVLAIRAVKLMLALINADVGGERTVVRIGGSRIVSVGEPPEAHDRVLDLAGDRLLPGLINAHDHLALNHLPGLEPAGSYGKVRQWIAEIDRRRRVEGPLKAAVAVPLAERLLLGAVENLLSGVTTVAHHDPLYPGLCEIQYPVRVVTKYSWAHSLYVEVEANLYERLRRRAAREPGLELAAATRRAV